MTERAGQYGVERGPARLSQFLACGAGLFVLGTVGFSSTLSWLLALSGAVLAGSGLFFGRFGSVSAGALVLLLAVLAAGTAGAPTLRVVSAVAATVFLWDVGRNAIDVGTQLGRDASTVRIELIHAVGTLYVAGLVAGLSYWLFSSSVTAPPVALLALLIAGTVLAVAFESHGTTSRSG